MEKGKNSGFYLFIFFVFIFYTFWNQGMAAERENLLSAYQDTGAEIEKIRIYSHARIHDSSFCFEEALKISRELAQKLDVPEIMISDKKADSKGENMEVSWKGKDHSGHTVSLNIHSIPSDSNQETYIAIEVVMADRWSELAGLEQKIKTALNPYGGGQINRCVIGTLEGKLTDEEKTRVVQTIVAGLRGKEMEVFKGEHIFSVTGLSRRIDDWIAYDGKKVNFQISLRYHSVEKKTYLWLGTPLIGISY